MDGSIRVLYVGGDSDARERANRLRARRASLSARVVYAMDDALSVLAEERIDCVVSEHTADGVDGLALLERIRDVDPAVPFVLFPAEGSEGVASDAIGAGVTDYVPRRSTDDCYEELAEACCDAGDQYLAETDVAMLNDLARNVYERITGAFFAVDRDWKFTYLNPEAEELLDVRAEDVIGENLWDAFSEAVGTTFYTEYHRALATQTATTFTEYYPPLETHFEVRAFPSEDGLSVHFREVDPTADDVADGAHLRELTTVLSSDLVDSIQRAKNAVNAAKSDPDPETIEEIAEALDRMDELVNHSITLAANPQS